MEEKKIILSVKDLNVKFRVRGRVLSAIRGVSLDFYENESVAIVGESGSGKSVFTKTFAGMLDANGYIDQGDIIFNDEELADTTVVRTKLANFLLKNALSKLNRDAKLENGAAVYRQILDLEKEKKERSYLSAEESEKIDSEIDDLTFKKTELFNQRQAIDKSAEKARYKEMGVELKAMGDQLKDLEKKKAAVIVAHKKAARSDTQFQREYASKMAELKARYAELTAKDISAETVARNEVIAKEMYLSVGRYGLKKRLEFMHKLQKAMKKAMQLGVNLNDEQERNSVFDSVVFRVKYLDETDTRLHGTCVLNLAKIRYGKDWTQIRGGKIATVFQDPMTSLNPIITIGKQITSVILKHQNCSELEARTRALELMKKVGIPNAESRFDDYPFQYSGGMRQRIVIAIALSCQPKILICDEPTTALDVTIQAQILKLIKGLQKEFN